MPELVRPPVLWFNGRIVPWAEATVHVWSEVATRGTNVFEGLRAYRDDVAGVHRSSRWTRTCGACSSRRGCFACRRRT